MNNIKPLKKKCKRCNRSLLNPTWTYCDNDDCIKLRAKDKRDKMYKTEPKPRQKTEAQITTILNKGIDKMHELNAIIEYKVVHGDTFNINAFEKHQLQSLIAVSNNGMTWKISDMDIRLKPCDVIKVASGVNSLVGIIFTKYRECKYVDANLFTKHDKITYNKLDDKVVEFTIKY